MSKISPRTLCFLLIPSGVFIIFSIWALFFSGSHLQTIEVTGPGQIESEPFARQLDPMALDASGSPYRFNVKVRYKLLFKRRGLKESHYQPVLQVFSKNSGSRVLTGNWMGDNETSPLAEVYSTQSLGTISVPHNDVFTPTLIINPNFIELHGISLVVRKNVQEVTLWIIALAILAMLPGIIMLVKESRTDV
jgi:hypothetical protein